MNKRRCYEQQMVVLSSEGSAAPGWQWWGSWKQFVVRLAAYDVATNLERSCYKRLVILLPVVVGGGATASGGAAARATRGGGCSRLVHGVREGAAPATPRGVLQRHHDGVLQRQLLLRQRRAPTSQALLFLSEDGGGAVGAGGFCFCVFCGSA